MGNSRRKKAQFLQDHPVCCYCGGQASTIDHCPPRSFFRGRHAPEGYEFPACDACNQATKDVEQVVACSFRFTLIEPELDLQMQKLIKGVKNNHPAIFREWHGTGGAARRRLLREKFGGAGDSMYREGFGAAEIGPDALTMMKQFGDKLLRALFYKHAGHRLNGRAFAELVSWINNDDYLDKALQFAPILPEMTNKCTEFDLGSQFLYRFNCSSDLGVFYAVVRIGERHEYRLFGFSKAGWDALTSHNLDVSTGFERLGLEATLFPQASE